MLSAKGFYLKNNIIFKARRQEKKKMEDNIWPMKSEFHGSIMTGKKEGDNTIIWCRKTE